jgi:predicted nuclease with RNAse H fold
MRKLTESGIRIRKFFQQKGFGVIEVYPGGAQDVLGIPRKKQGIEKLRLGLETLGIEGLIHANSNHELDAATCAYTAKLFIEDKAMIYGIPSQGIVMPKGKLVK